jgi:hypothetical protein
MSENAALNFVNVKSGSRTIKCTCSRNSLNVRRLVYGIKSYLISAK